MLKDKIYDHFIKKESKKEVQERITFAPSYFNDCQRKIYYKKTGEPVSNPIDQAGYFKMELGSAGHDKIQNIIKELPDVKLHEYEDMKNINYEGLEFNYRIDGKIEINNKFYILEIKTVYANGFRSIENEPKKEHLMQLYLYMLFEKINNGIILYVGRDNGFMIEYVYNIKEIDIKPDFSRLIDLKKMIEKKEVPSKEYKIQIKNMGDSLSENFTKDKVKYKSDWQCSYCQWKDKCWNRVYERIRECKFYINGIFSKE